MYNGGLMKVQDLINKLQTFNPELNINFNISIERGRGVSVSDNPTLYLHEEEDGLVFNLDGDETKDF
jgi:hypothetical protein